MWFLFAGYKTKTPASKALRKRNGKKVVGLVGLGMLFGITWLLAIPMFDDARLTFQYIFALLNSLQGLFIFIFQFAIKEDVRNDWKTHVFNTWQSIKGSTGQTSGVTLTMLSTLPRKSNKNSQDQSDRRLQSMGSLGSSNPVLSSPASETLGAENNLFSEITAETDLGKSLVKAMMY